MLKLGQHERCGIHKTKNKQKQHQIKILNFCWLRGDIIKSDHIGPKDRLLTYVYTQRCE